MTQKKVLTIQDISCTGRCSITVALPVLSACGLETAILPTSILSTHTGGFTGYHHRDLTGDMEKILEHWKTLQLHFDAIYVGFLANEAQVTNTLHVIEELRSEDTLVFVDPAMADEGELYSLLAEDFPSQMRRLCQISDVMVPNMTESFLLLQESYKPGPYDPAEIDEMLRRLAKINQSQVVMTGVTTNDREMGAASYHSGSGRTHTCSCRKQEGIFYGTGDVFMSTLIGAMLNGFSIDEGIDIACKFVLDCIERTVAAGADYRYGVDFEQGIPLLLNLLGLQIT